jgi:transcription elongation factor Elf1
MNCPHCNHEDSIEVVVDAYAIYAFEGFDDLGQPTVTKPSIRIDEFDDTHAQCGVCGYILASY